MERQLEELREALQQVVQERKTVEERLAQVVAQLGAARLAMDDAFAMLQDLRSRPVSGPGQVRAVQVDDLEKRYADARQGWVALTTQQQQLQARLASLTNDWEAGIVMHRQLYQRLRGITEDAGA